MSLITDKKKLLIVITSIVSLIIASIIIFMLIKKPTTDATDIASSKVIEDYAIDNITFEELTNILNEQKENIDKENIVSTESPNEFYLLLYSEGSIGLDYELDKFTKLMSTNQITDYYTIDNIKNKETYLETFANQDMVFMVKYQDGEEVYRWLGVPETIESAEVKGIVKEES